MCGIAGIVDLENRPADREPLERMCDAMDHRGPDDAGYYLNHRAALGQRRLSIIDLATGRQPMSNEDGTVWVSFNGEIYNFQQLRAELEQQGHRFATSSDTEVIVHAYEAYGQQCMMRLRGMFALAVWDERRQTLLLARDRVGKKPLFYTETNGRFLFASELQALMAHPAVSKDLDHAAIDDYLTYGYIPAPRTAFRGVCKLPPAHYLTLTLDGTAHLSEQWPEVTPQRIRTATARLASQLRRIRLPLTVYPCAEVTVRPDMEDMWRRGELLSVADRRSYLLMELPPGVFVDLRGVAGRLQELGVRPILAHPERRPEYLHGAGAVDELIRLGCLVQVSAESIVHASSRHDLRALRRWVRRGIVHLVASDGHSPTSRPPRMAQAYDRVAGWAGAAVADRICSTNGLTVLQGLPLHRTQPAPLKRRRWFFRFDGSSGLQRVYHPDVQRAPLLDRS